MALLQPIHMGNVKVLSLLFWTYHQGKLLKVQYIVGQTARLRPQGKKKSGTMWMALSQLVHMCNMKALSLLLVKDKV